MKTRYALIAVASLVASIAHAQGPHEGPPGPDLDRMAILLELDDSQKLEVERILKEQREARRAGREAARQANTRPSREEMQQKRTEERQAVLAQLQTVLTPEQIKKYEAMTDRPMRPRSRD